MASPRGGSRRSGELAGQVALERAARASLYGRVKGAREDLFERRYGFWRGVPDGVVALYLDCGIVERGLARVRSPDCAAEHLLAFITDGRAIRRILDHLGASARRATQDRAPPLAAAPVPDSL